MARNRPRSFGAQTAGATALEFALVAPIFLALCFSAFEGGWMMTKSMMLDRALDTTVRLLRVGAADAPVTQDDMKQALCDQLTIVPHCENVLTVEMRTINSASDFPATDATCINRGETVHPTVSFTPGLRSSIMYVRACVVSDALTPGIGIALGMTLDAKGGYSLVSQNAFMNEPGA